jgi:hypothetical protein
MNTQEWLATLEQRVKDLEDDNRVINNRTRAIAKRLNSMSEAWSIIE